MEERGVEVWKRERRERGDDDTGNDRDSDGAVCEDFGREVREG